MENDHQVILAIEFLNFIFSLMFNYMKFIDFATTIFLNHMYKICLYIFIKIQANVKTYKIS